MQMKIDKLMKSVKTINMSDDMKKRLTERCKNEEPENTLDKRKNTEYVITADRNSGPRVWKYILPAVCVLLLIAGAVKIIPGAFEKEVVNTESNLHKDPNSKVVEQPSVTDPVTSETKTTANLPEKCVTSVNTSNDKSSSDSQTVTSETENNSIESVPNNDTVTEIKIENEPEKSQATMPSSVNNNDPKPESSESESVSEVAQIHYPCIIAHDPVSERTILRMLNSLSYSAETCDGIPEYVIYDPDGPVYYLNISSGDSGWVWRTGICCDGSVKCEEAKLTESAINMITEYKNAYGLREFEG